jgi:hypothetical protein
VLFVILLYAVVGEMHEAVVDIFKRILIAREAEVAFLVEPDAGRIEVLD